MNSQIYEFNPILQAFLFGLFTWFMTLIGSSIIFLNKKESRKLSDSMLGFAGGIMLSASFFSLILPSIEYSKSLSVPLWFPVASGFLFGSFFLFLLDKTVPHLHLNFKIYEREGLKKELPLYFLFILAIILHNIPEGLSVGVSFGSLKYDRNYNSFLNASSLALGIGIQNLPEGLAISLPLLASGMSKFKSFFIGQLSGFVEPIFAFLGSLLVFNFSNILPYALSFSAGAMIYVVIEEVIPETQRGENTDLSTISFILGFILMMIFDMFF